LTRYIVAAAMALLLLAGCAASPPPAVEPDDEARASDGRDIAEAECASCHAVGRYGDSPNADAPPFRTVLSRYSAAVLEEELIAGIQVAHPMPDFQFNPQGTDALIAYLQSIQEERAPSTP
jgi:mono/diheme cytochrome c family protein